MKLLSRIFVLLLSAEYRRSLPVLSVRRIWAYFFFQRILRVNAHVPWPVHWASVVTCPEKITRKSLRPIPGSMPGQVFLGENGIHIGANVRLAPGVKMISVHPDVDDFDRSLPSAPIIVGDNCWLGSNAILLPGVQLGDHTIVGAGAVVYDSYPRGNLVLAGNPARPVKDIDAYTGSTPVTAEEV